jgi:hypothetical protein
MGTIENFGTVWFNPESIANILSLAQVRKVRRVTMDTDVQPAFHVHTADGSGYTVFSEHASGLYLHDSNTGVSYPTTVAKPTSPIVIGYSYLQTVAANKATFTKRQIDDADKARALYRTMGRPGPARFLDAIKQNHIINCPITVDDALRAERIYGKDMAYLKGKSTASPAKDHVPDQPPVPLPSNLLSSNLDVTLCVDLFYVLGLPFYLSTSRNIHFLSCRALTTRTKESINSSIRSDLDMYRHRGFQPNHIHADGEFNVFKSSFPGVRFSICSADDHVPEIERAIRTVKDTVRATIHGLPYHRLPRVLVQELVLMAVRTINMLPHSDGLSSTMSPTTIVMGMPKPDYNTMQLEFGSYVQVYDGTSNDTKSRTMGAIATNPTGNSSGDYFFMSIETGRRIHRRSWTLLPISDAAISLVEALAFQENMPPIDQDNMVHEYDPDDIADESHFDRDYVPTSDHDSDHNLTTDAYTDSSSDDSDDSDDDSDTGHNDSYDAEPFLVLPALPAVPVTAPGNTEERRFAHTTPIPPRNEERQAPPPIVNEITATVAAVPDNEECTDVFPATATTVPRMEERNTSSPSVTFAATHSVRTILPDTVEPSLASSATDHRPVGLRPKKTPNYAYRFGFAQIAHSIKSVPSTPDVPDTPPAPSGPSLAVHKAIVGLLFTQMSANKGIKKHGQAAFDALRKEFEQFKAMELQLSVFSWRTVRIMMRRMAMHAFANNDEKDGNASWVSSEGRRVSSL